MNKNDGSLAKIELLRPKWWFVENSAIVGETLPLNMPELRLSGNAFVTSIDECPKIENKKNAKSNVVIGKFIHENAIVFDLYFEGNDKPIGVA